jgi:hypothetical protein
MNSAPHEVNKATLLLALLIACASGVLSVLMIRSPEHIGAAAILLFPGAVLAIVAGGNIHDFRTWVVVVGNFAFYFGIVYLVSKIRERYTRGGNK